jgi:hypothetical protein
LRSELNRRREEECQSHSYYRHEQDNTRTNECGSGYPAAVLTEAATSKGSTSVECARDNNDEERSQDRGRTEGPPFRRRSDKRDTNGDFDAACNTPVLLIHAAGEPEANHCESGRKGRGELLTATEHEERPERTGTERQSGFDSTHRDPHLLEAARRSPRAAATKSSDPDTDTSSRC